MKNDIVGAESKLTTPFSNERSAAISEQRILVEDLININIEHHRGSARKGVTLQANHAIEIIESKTLDDWGYGLESASATQRTASRATSPELEREVQIVTDVRSLEVESYCNLINNMLGDIVAASEHVAHDILARVRGSIIARHTFETQYFEGLYGTTVVRDTMQSKIWEPAETDRKFKKKAGKIDPPDVILDAMSHSHLLEHLKLELPIVTSQRQLAELVQSPPRFCTKKMSPAMSRYLSECEDRIPQISTTHTSLLFLPHLTCTSDELVPTESTSADTSMLLSPSSVLESYTYDDLPALTRSSSASSSEDDASTNIEEPLIANRRLLVEDAAGILVTRPRPGPPLRLQCPFTNSGCFQIYTQLDDWISHSLIHFKGCDPPKINHCIFCDWMCTDQSGHQSWAYFMNHLAFHYECGYTLSHARPNFQLSSYMSDAALVDDVDYRGYNTNHVNTYARNDMLLRNWVNTESSSQSSSAKPCASQAGKPVVLEQRQNDIPPLPAGHSSSMGAKTHGREVRTEEAEFQNAVDRRSRTI